MYIETCLSRTWDNITKRKPVFNVKFVLGHVTIYSEDKSETGLKRNYISRQYTGTPLPLHSRANTENTSENVLEERKPRALSPLYPLPSPSHETSLELAACRCNFKKLLIRPDDTCRYTYDCYNDTPMYDIDISPLCRSITIIIHSHRTAEPLRKYELAIPIIIISICIHM